MTDPNIQYLEQEDISGVIAKGLAVLYLEQPQFPVDFLAKWLITYSRNKQHKAKFIDEETKEQTLILKEKHRITAEENQAKEKEAMANQIIEEENKFRQLIISHQNHEELIDKVFCDTLKQKFQLSGVYVCELDFPRKEVAIDREDDENAHLDQNLPKILRYVAASHESRFLIDKTLALETGVTYEVLKEQVPDENGVVPPNNGIYIPDVVKDTRIVYHQWPKLGSFYAVPLVYNSCLQEQFFDACVEARIQYQKQREEQRKEREAKEQELEEQIQLKIEAGEDVAALEQELQNYRDGLEQVAEPAFQTLKREFVLCCDTLGLDREIPENHRAQIMEYVQLLASSWEDRERQFLSDDIDRQIKYLEFIGVNTKEMIDQFQQDEDAHVEANIEKFEELKEKNEKEYQYEIDCLRLEKLKEQLLDRNFMSSFTQLGESNLIKFSGVIQAVLYLLQYDKAKINIPGTNLLNWRYVRTLVNDSLIDRLVAFSHRGARNAPKYPWCLVNRVQKRLEKFDQEQVDQYCLPFGRILKLLNVLCRLRKVDIEIRRAKIEVKRQLIQTIQAEIAVLQEEKQKQLQAEKDQMAPEDLEAFSQEEWETAWDAEHPLPEVPENPEDEVDGDYEFEQVA